MFRSRRLSNPADLSRTPQSCCRPARQHPRRVDLQLETLEDRVVPTGLINLVPGDATIPFSPSSQIAPITVQVSTPLGQLNLGTVDIALLVNGQPVSLGSANVTNGQATVSLPVPGGLLSGTYTLVEDLLNGGTLLGAVPGSLTVTGDAATGNPNSTTGGGGGTGGGSGGGSGSGSGAAGQTPLQAAIEIAIDTAAILSQGNVAGEAVLQIASQMFLNQQLPSNLFSDLLNHIPVAGGLALPGIEVGIQFANNLGSGS